MTPKDLGLPADNPQIQEAVAVYDRNCHNSIEEDDLRPALLRLLQKRRHEDTNLLCLALLGGMPQMLNGLLRERFEQYSPRLVTFIETTQKMPFTGYAGAGAEPDTVKLYALAHAVATLDTADGALVDVARYQALAAETKGRSPDPGLENILARKIEARRALNRQNVKVPDFGARTLMRDDTVRKAYDLLGEYAADGRVRPENVDSAVRTAEHLSLKSATQDPCMIAAALLDLGLMGSRVPADLPRIEAALGADGKDAAEMLKKSSVRYLSTDASFRRMEPRFRSVAVAAFLAESDRKLADAEKFLDASGRKNDAPAVRIRLRALHELEGRARRIIAPALDQVPHESLRSDFSLKLNALAAFNKAHPLPPAPPQLPPAVF